MSFPVDEFGINQRVEAKCYNLGFSPAKHLASILRRSDEEVTIMTYALPAQEWYLPKALDIRTEGVTIIAHTNFATQALELKRKYPALRIFLDPRVHAKMTLTSGGQIWIGSANLCLSHSLDGTIGLESPAMYAYLMDEIQRYHLTDPSKEVTLDFDDYYAGEHSSTEPDFTGMEDE